MLVGNDISNAQGAIDWATYSKNTHFVIMKATEGIGYIDSWFGNNRIQARNYNLLLGYYHFARPDLGNTAINEADYFLKVLSGDPIRIGEIVVLDFEVSYAGDVVGWCKAWLNHVSSQLNGIKPLIYLNQSLIKSYDWSSVVNAGYGLWVADYTYDPNMFDATISPWGTAALQQWTDKQEVPGISGDVDGDCFFGNGEAFKKYGYQLPITPPVIPSVPVVPSPAPPSSIGNLFTVAVIVHSSWSWFGTNAWYKKLALLRKLI